MAQDALLWSLPIGRLSIRPFTPLNDFSEIPGPNFLQSSCEAFCYGRGVCVCVGGGGVKIFYTNGHGPLIKMPAMPIFFSRNEKVLMLSLGI